MFQKNVIPARLLALDLASPVRIHSVPLGRGIAQGLLSQVEEARSPCMSSTGPACRPSVCLCEVPVIGEDLQEARKSEKGKQKGLHVRNTLSPMLSCWAPLTHVPHFASE